MSSIKQRYVRLELTALCLAMILISGCGKSDSSGSTTTSTAPDPVNEFKAIASKAAERAKAGYGWLYSDTLSDGSPHYNRNDIRYSEPKFDIKKTDSLLSPYEATISYSYVTFSCSEFKSEQSAKSATLPAEIEAMATNVGQGGFLGVGDWRIMKPKSGPLIHKFHYVDNKWVPDEETSFPSISKHWRDQKKGMERLYPPLD